MKSAQKQSRSLHTFWQLEGFETASYPLSRRMLQQLSARNVFLLLLLFLLVLPDLWKPACCPIARPSLSRRVCVPMMATMHRNRWLRPLQPMMRQRQINKRTMLRMPWLLKLMELLLLPQLRHPLLLHPHLRRRCPRRLSLMPPNPAFLLRRRSHRRLARQLRWLLRK
jgi:hypothetical protein